MIFRNRLALLNSVRRPASTGVMGNRSSQSSEDSDRADDLGQEEEGKHSECDRDVLYRIPDLEKSLKCGSSDVFWTQVSTRVE